MQPTSCHQSMEPPLMRTSCTIFGYFWLKLLDLLCSFWWTFLFFLSVFLIFAFLLSLINQKTYDIHPNTRTERRENTGKREEERQREREKGRGRERGQRRGKMEKREWRKRGDVLTPPCFFSFFFPLVLFPVLLHGLYALLLFFPSSLLPPGLQDKARMSNQDSHKHKNSSLKM